MPLAAVEDVPRIEAPLSAEQERWLERAWAAVSADELAALDLALTSLPSPTGQERQIAEFLTGHLRAEGLEAWYQPIDDEQGNAVGRLTGDGSGADLLLYAPTDTAFSGDADEELPLVGKVRVATYPIAERLGLVWVYVGELPAPPVDHDIPSELLANPVCLGGRISERAGNWRYAAEDGFDASHIYIHRNSPLIIGLRRPLPLATVLSSREGMLVAEEGQPKGLVKGSGKCLPIWETTVDGASASSRFKPGPDAGRTSPDTSMWLPCGLKVDPFPTPGMIQFEWYVPVDEASHWYFVTWGKHVATPAEAEAFFAETRSYWKPLVIGDFNNDDVLAREAMQRFYAAEDGWHRERLYRPDLIITQWRKLASTHNRGIQRRPR